VVLVGEKEGVGNDVVVLEPTGDALGGVEEPGTAVLADEVSVGLEKTSAVNVDDGIGHGSGCFG
jgi:hypothetical protein